VKEVMLGSDNWGGMLEEACKSIEAELCRDSWGVLGCEENAVNEVAIDEQDSKLGTNASSCLEEMSCRQLESGGMLGWVAGTECVGSSGAAKVDWLSVFIENVNRLVLRREGGREGDRNSSNLATGESVVILGVRLNSSVVEGAGAT
jgi:hypothetical protein